MPRVGVAVDFYSPSCACSCSLSQFLDLVAVVCSLTRIILSFSLSLSSRLQNTAACYCFYFVLGCFMWRFCDMLDSKNGVHVNFNVSAV